jgi:hypothetical protein
MTKTSMAEFDRMKQVRRVRTEGRYALNDLGCDRASMSLIMESSNRN